MHSIHTYKNSQKGVWPKLLPISIDNVGFCALEPTLEFLSQSDFNRYWLMSCRCSFHRIQNQPKPSAFASRSQCGRFSICHHILSWKLAFWFYRCPRPRRHRCSCRACRVSVCCVLELIRCHCRNCIINMLMTWLDGWLVRFHIESPTPLSIDSLWGEGRVAWKAKAVIRYRTIGYDALNRMSFTIILMVNCTGLLSILLDEL